MQHQNLFMFESNFDGDVDGMRRFLSNGDVLQALYLFYYAENLLWLDKYLGEFEDSPDDNGAFFSEQLKDEATDLHDEIKTFLSFQMSVINSYSLRLEALQEKIDSDGIDLDERDLLPVWQKPNQ